MGARASITQHWTDGSITDIEVATDDPTHPDMLDELTGRVIAMYRELCETDPEDAES